MNADRTIAVCVLLLVACVPLDAQHQEAGTADYALANSSVLWLPASSSLFLNPGELARLHQDEFLVSSGRFNSLGSMSSGVFVPFLGTFGLGAAPQGASTLYSAGYGSLVGKYSTVGGALSARTNVEGAFRFSFGGAFHMPFTVEESGFHAGLSVVNLPTRGVVNAGAGYWLMPSTLRLQFATQTRQARAALVGAEVQLSGNVRLQAGIRGFQKLTGGVEYASSYARFGLGAGQEGLSFTVNVRIGDAAADRHQQALDEANEAFADQRYSEARRMFSAALQYDEYDDDARMMQARSLQVMDSSMTALLKQAQDAEQDDDYPTAMEAYAAVLKMNPAEPGVASQSALIAEKFHSYITRLFASGDSLLSRHEVARARSMFDQILKFDPENDSASARIDEIENLSRENVRAMISRARSLLNRNRLDEAESEYQKVLDAEPKNSQARAGLNTIHSRRVKGQMETARTSYNEKKYFDALTMFADILQKDPGNKEARQYLEKTRDALKADIDRLFKKGLEYYIKEDYRSAIAEWDKVLMIQPSDSSTIEYRKRAEEKMKALEQFK